MSDLVTIILTVFLFAATLGLERLAAHLREER